jgi:hypothetical protein
MHERDRPTLPEIDVSAIAAAMAGVGAERAPGPRERAFARLGSLRSVPRVAVRAPALQALPLDHRGGFLLSRVDGKSSVETILDVSAMPREEVFDLLVALADAGIIALG